MPRRCGSIWIGWALAVGLSCEGGEARPPTTGDCNDVGCTNGRRITPPVRVGVPIPGAGAGGGGGEGGAGGMPPPAVGALVGSVRMIVEPDLLGSASPNAALEIRAPGPDDTEIVGVPGTDGSFTLDGVLAEEEAWVAVGSFDIPPSEPFMDTLQVVNSAGVEAVGLVVMRRSVMEEISQVSFFSNPLELDPARGHALIQFVDDLGNPIPDLSVIFPTPDTVGVAYDLGAIYSDSEVQTSTRGTVVLLNVPASRYPGILTSVVVEALSVPAQQFRPAVRVAAGSVTVLRVELDLTP